MLSKELEFTLNLAFKEAREKRHEFMTVEHLMLALLDNTTAADVLKSCGADLPAAAVKYVRRLEELVGAPVTLLSTSPERRDTIMVRDPFA